MKEKQGVLALTATKKILSLEALRNPCMVATLPGVTVEELAKEDLDRRPPLNA